MQSRIAGLACAAGVLAGPWVVVPAGAQPQQPEAQGFYVPTLDPDVARELEDVNAAIAEARWEDAFNTFDEVLAGELSGLMPLGDGWYAPARRHVARVLTGLPAEGRAAYRLYFDGSARRIWDQATTPQQRLAAAEDVVNRYALTDIADEAADLLGDAAFQAGRFHEAERWYRSVLDDHPASNLSTVRMQVKRAAAMARAGRADDFDALRSMLLRRHPNATVTLGGEDMPLADALTRLAEAVDGPRLPRNPVASAGDEPGRATDLLPAADARPAWALDFFQSGGHNALRRAAEENGLGASFTAFVPPVEIVGDQLIFNWFGYVAAMDTGTGKLLWRYPDLNFATISQRTNRFMNFQRSYAEPEDFTLRVHPAGVVLAGLTPLDELRPENRRVVRALDAQTGEPLWSTDEVDSLDGWHPITPAEPWGNLAIMGMVRGTAADVVLIALDIRTGAERWRVPLGTAITVTNRVYENVVPSMTTAASDDFVFVLTNNGALLCVDPGAGELQWAFTYGGTTNLNQGRNRFNRRMTNPAYARLQDGEVVIDGEQVIFKESDNTRMYCIDPDGRELVWRRETTPAADLVAVTDDRIYLMHGDLDAIDRQTLRLMPEALDLNVGRSSVAISGDQLVAFVDDGRLIEVDTVSMDKTRREFQTYHERSAGGLVLRHGDRLLLVSNLGIVAYDLPTPETEATAAESAAPSDVVAPSEAAPLEADAEAAADGPPPPDPNPPVTPAAGDTP